MKNKDNAVFTRGSIGGTMVKTAFAMVAGTLAMSGYNIADTYFVGKLPGAEPMAAMGFTFPVIMLIGCVFHGLGIGVVTNSSQALGANKRAKAAGLISAGLLLILLVSVTIAILGMTTASGVFSLFGAKGHTLEMVKEYMNIWYFGCATAALAMAGNSILISIGTPRTASALMMAGMIINVILDPIFIFGFGFVPAMGIRGAAIATIISQCFSTVAMIILLYKVHRLLEFKAIPWKKLRKSWGTMIRFAIPATIGMLLMPIGSAIITKITSNFGDVAVAATAAAGRLEMVAFIFPMALGMSLLPMIGQNYGARLYGRIRQCRRFAMRFAFFYLLVMAVFYFIFARHLVAIFSDVPEVQELMVICMQIIPWGFAMIEIHRYSGFFFTGCGHPHAAAWLNSLRIVGLMIPFSFVALYFNSLAGLFWARLAADVLAGAVGWVFSRRMVNSLPEDGEPPPAKAVHRNLFDLIRHGRLLSIASAQADIDNRSSTQ